MLVAFAGRITIEALGFIAEQLGWRARATRAHRAVDGRDLKGTISGQLHWLVKRVDLRTRAWRRGDKTWPQHPIWKLGDYCQTKGFRYVTKALPTVPTSAALMRSPSDWYHDV